MVNNYFIIIILYVLLLLSYYLYKTYYIKKNINSYDIPIVIICWNNYRGFHINDEYYSDAYPLSFVSM